MESSLRALKWRYYYGESGDPPSSEDEAYFKARPQGYTRDEMTERRLKQESIEDFEAERFKDSQVQLVTKATHRGAAPCSVRPRKGTEVIASYCVKRTEEVVIKKERAVWMLGQPEASLLLQTVETYIKKMRRGETIIVSCNDPDTGSPLEIQIELHTVCDLRRLAPVASGPWQAKTSGYIEKKRLFLPRDDEDKGARRPRWGDTVGIRYSEQVDDDSEMHFSTQAMIHQWAYDRLEIGKGAAVEGLEAALLAMKLGEVALLSWTGEFDWNEQLALDSKVLASSTRVKRIILRLDAIESPDEPDNPAQEAERQATDLKSRGAALFKAGRYRRAEALFTRALQWLDLCQDMDDSERRRTEESLVVPLFLNVAQCARKREAFKDEENLISKALLVKRQQKNDPQFRAKAYVRRANTRIDLGDKSGAKDDLRLANEAARQIIPPDNTVFLADIRRILERLKHFKPKQPLLAKAAKALQKRDPQHNEKSEKDKAPTTETFGLLYEKEINGRLKAAKPWLHDPDYDHREHAPRAPVDKLPTVLKEDDLKSEYKKLDEKEEEYEKMRQALEQGYVMRQMYDTNGTGRRGKQPVNGSADPTGMMGGGMLH